VTSSVRRQPEHPYNRVYACNTGYKPGRAGFRKACGKILIKAEFVENDVAERVLARLSRPDSARRLAEQKLDDGSGTAGADLARLEAQLTQLGIDFADQLIGRTEFLAARNRIHDKIQEIERRIAGAGPRLVLPLGDPEALHDWWESAPLARKQALVRQYVDRVEVGRHTGRRSEHDPTRVVVHWR
jgi:hypothetical protein